MIARLIPDQRIPEPLREIYGHLAGGLIETYELLNELVCLYSTSEDVVDLLNTTAAAFFVRHEGLLIDGIILSLARMTDRKESGHQNRHRQQNLTLDRLFLELPDGKYDALRSELQRKWLNIEKTALPLRTYRHKIIAHADLAHYLARQTDLGDEISISRMRKLLGEISVFLAAFDYCFTGVESHYQPPGAHGTASDLIAYLKLGLETDAERRRQLITG